MKTDIQISTVTIAVAGKKIELTIAQARELRDVLNDAFPLGSPFTSLVPLVPLPITVDPSRPEWPPQTWCSMVNVNGMSSTLCLIAQ
jgi:hypothetical protein